MSENEFNGDVVSLTEVLLDAAVESGNVFNVIYLSEGLFAHYGAAITDIDNSHGSALGFELYYGDSSTPCNDSLRREYVAIQRNYDPSSWIYKKNLQITKENKSRAA